MPLMDMQMQWTWPARLGVDDQLEGGSPNKLRRNHTKHTDNAPTINPNHAELRRQNLNQAAAAQPCAQLMAEELNMYVAEVVAGAPPLTPFNATDWPCYYKVARARQELSGRGWAASRGSGTAASQVCLE